MKSQGSAEKSDNDTTLNSIKPKVTEHRGATTFSKLGVQFLGIGITTLLQKKIDRSTQFGAVGYIIKLYSSKSYVKSWGVRPNFEGSGAPTLKWLRPC